METSIFSRKSLDYKLTKLPDLPDAHVIEEEKKRREEEERKKNPNGPFIPLYAPEYAPEPGKDLPEEKPKEKEEKRIIKIDYDSDD